MKHYHLASVLNLKDSNVPSPFPGMYPTRIGYVVEGENRTVNYFGKPNKIAVQRYLDARNATDCKTWLEFEIDRANVVTWRACGRVTDRSHASLQKLYHPFHNMEGIAEFSVPWFRKRIAGFTVYSPYERLRMVMVKEFKAWLVASGLVRGKQVELLPQIANTYKTCGACGHVSLATMRTCPMCGRAL